MLPSFFPTAMSMSMSKSISKSVAKSPLSEFCLSLYPSLTNLSKDSDTELEQDTSKSKL